MSARTGADRASCGRRSAGRSPGCASRPRRRSTLSYRKIPARAALVVFLAASLARSRSGPAGRSSPAGCWTDEAGILEAPTTLAAGRAPAAAAGRRSRRSARWWTRRVRSSRRRRPTGRIWRPPSPGLPPAQRQAMIEPYVKVRTAVVAYRDALASWREQARSRTSQGRVRCHRALAVPPGLPGEFDDYLRGAIAYQRDDPGAARAAWEKLLARPAAERRRRSTWAAFMLGKTARQGRSGGRGPLVRAHPRARGPGIRRSARARRGQPRLAGARRDEPPALRRGAEALPPAGEGRAIPPPCPRSAAPAPGLWTTPSASGRWPARPRRGPIFTAWVLSCWTRRELRRPARPDGRPGNGWRRSSPPGSPRPTAPTAWPGPPTGPGTSPPPRHWLRRAPADAPMARWIRAKLLLRAGKVAEAEALLAQAAAALPAGSGPDARSLARLRRRGAQPAVRPRAAGELGAVRLARGEYAAALDDLLRGGWWIDAAYVAERVLTVDELRAYVDKTWPAALAARYERREYVDEPGCLGDPVRGPRAAAGRADRLRPPLPPRPAPGAGRPPRRRAPLPAGASGGRRWTTSPVPWRRGARRPVRPPSGRRRSSAPPASPAIRGWSCSAPRSSPTGSSIKGISSQDPFAEARANPETHRLLGPSPDERQRVGPQPRRAATSASITGIRGWIWPRRRRSCCPAAPRRGPACSPPPATGSRGSIRKAPGRSTTPFRAAAPIPRSPAARARSTRSRTSRTPARRM